MPALALAMATPEALGQPLIGLTASQYAVLLELTADGPDNNTLAERLFISPDTVKSHIKALLALTGYATRTELAVAYLRGRFGVGVGLPAGTVIDGDTVTRVAFRGPSRGTRYGQTPPPPKVRAAAEPLTHAMGAWFTDCCHLPATDLPGSHRITRDPAAVTCLGRDLPTFD